MFSIFYSLGLKKYKVWGRLLCRHETIKTKNGKRHYIHMDPCVHIEEIYIDRLEKRVFVHHTSTVIASY